MLERVGGLHHVRPWCFDRAGVSRNHQIGKWRNTKFTFMQQPGCGMVGVGGTNFDLIHTRLMVTSQWPRVVTNHSSRTRDLQFCSKVAINYAVGGNYCCIPFKKVNCGTINVSIRG